MKGIIRKVSDFRMLLNGEALKVIEKSFSFKKDDFLFSDLKGTQFLMQVWKIYDNLRLNLSFS